MNNHYQKHHNNRPDKQQNRQKPIQEKGSIYEFEGLEFIGSGAFASVYKAFEPMIPNTPVSSCREVALKCINLDEIQNKNAYRTTINEDNLLKLLEHENIVRCYYSFSEVSLDTYQNYLVFVMEYCDGGDLEEWIQAYAPSRGLMPPPLVLEKDIWGTFRQIAKAVEYIHSKRIIHRDLKPPNILLTSQGVVKLTDFGLSIRSENGVTAETFGGTPYYMSPERITKQPYSFESDIWSLGCILYEMAALESPFYGEKGNGEVLRKMILKADFPPLPENCYTQQFERLILACLDPDTTKRPSASRVCQIAEHMYSRLTNKQR